MKLKHKVILCNWHNDIGMLSGPCNVFYYLSKELLALSEDVILLTPETCNRNFKKLVAQMLKYCLISKDNTVIVNENGFKLPIFILLLSKLCLRNKYYLISHGIVRLEDKYSKVKHEKYYLIENLLHKYFPNTICVSQFLKGKIQTTFNRNKNLYVVYNGIDESEITNFKYKEINNEFRLIMSGGIKEVKGIFELLDIIKTINKRELPYKCFLDVYGYADDENILNDFNAYLKDENLCQFIKYGGIISKDELMEKYKEAHFSIAPSWFDTFNMSIVESMAKGTPAIVSDRCGAAEIIKEKENGFLVHMNGDYKEEIISILNFAFQNRESYNNIRKNCLENINEFTWNNIARKYLETVKSLSNTKEGV